MKTYGDIILAANPGVDVHGEDGGGGVEDGGEGGHQGGQHHRHHGAPHPNLSICVLVLQNSARDLHY